MPQGQSRLVLHVDESLCGVQADVIMSSQVLVVEDHPLVAHAMLDLLSRAGQDLDVHVATDAAEAALHLGNSGRDWFRIFLDLDVPGAHGLSLAREIHAWQLADRCCVVTALNRLEFSTELNNLGFLGYIVKASPFAEFERAIARVLDGEATFPSGLSKSRSPIRLSRRQEQLLDCVRRGLSSKEIARVVSLSEGTVNNCINAVLKAMNVTSRTHAVAKALELGLLTVNARDEERTSLLTNRRST